MSSLFVAIILAVILILSEGYTNSPRTAAVSTTIKKQIVSNGWKSSVSVSGSFSRLYAAAPEAPKGRGPPPRKAPKDDVVQVKSCILLSD